MKYAPIALFTYNRADKTRTVIECLLQNKEATESDLIVFSDGPKNEKAVNGVAENRLFLKTITGFKSITIVERDKNWGLANSIISGISEILNRCGRVIVVEDDLLLSRYFLKYMNDGLEKYKDDSRVASIGGFLHPVDIPTPETFFLRNFGCWGWATWKRGWDLFNPDAKDLLRQLRWKKKDFNMGGGAPLYGILYCQKVGLVDSWALRFSAACFLAGKLQLIPGRNMAIQNGMDGTGTHSGVNNRFSDMRLSDIPVDVADIEVKESKEMYDAYSKFFWKGRNKYAPKQLFLDFKSFVRRLLNLDAR